MEHWCSTMALCLCAMSFAYLVISVYPYSGYMAIALIPSANEENAGYYAGLLASAFMIGRSFTAYACTFLSFRLLQAEQENKKSTSHSSFTSLPVVDLRSQWLRPYPHGATSPGGKAADIYGRRTILFTSLLSSILFSLLFGLSTSFPLALFALR